MREKKFINRNKSLGLYRYIFSIFIVILHFRSMYPNAPEKAFCGGYLGVEFFFITSGYFLMQYKRKNDSLKTEQNIFKNLRRYLLVRWSRLFPMYFLSIICLAIFRIYLISEISIRQFFTEGLWEICMMQAMGLPWLMNGHLWYVSALLISSMLIFYLLERDEDKYINIYAPLIFIIIMANMFRMIGHLDVGLDYHFPICDGLWRAFAEIGLGCIIYSVCEQIRGQVDLSKAKIRTIVTIIEAVLLVIIIRICFYTCREVLDFTAVILIAVLVLCIMLGNSFIDSILNNRVSDYLGKISYGIYVNQLLFLRVFLICFPSYDFWKITIVYILVLTIFSAVLNYFLETVQRTIKQSSKNFMIP